MDRKEHWNNIYKKTQPTQVPWYEAYPEVSYNLIKATGVGHDGSIIDVGGGVASLVDTLLLNGYKRISVLDISAYAIERAKERLGDKAGSVTWYEADITEARLTETYDVWHDRAVFHFLTDAGDRKRYINVLRQSLKPGGYLIIGTFSIDGPLKCSGLDVVRYSPETLSNEFGDGFDLIDSFGIEHITPANKTQRFVFCCFKRVG
ncbi:MAG: class I SAM-dependent methyltransferase [Nitrospirae bacterium]|nr:class I SAM-dependent methyltransferase [Nitrospirota bacterium]